MSGDGQTVSFATAAQNLISPDTNGPWSDVFVRECPHRPSVP